MASVKDSLFQSLLVVGKNLRCANVRNDSIIYLSAITKHNLSIRG